MAITSIGFTKFRISYSVEGHASIRDRMWHFVFCVVPMASARRSSYFVAISSSKQLVLQRHEASYQITHFTYGPNQHTDDLSIYHWHLKPQMIYRLASERPTPFLKREQPVQTLASNIPLLGEPGLRRKQIQDMDIRIWLESLLQAESGTRSLLSETTSVSSEWGVVDAERWRR